MIGFRFGKWIDSLHGVITRKKMEILIDILSFHARSAES
jgi:hypothetical protein